MTQWSPEDKIDDRFSNGFIIGMGVGAAFVSVLYLFLL